MDLMKKLTIKQQIEKQSKIIETAKDKIKDIQSKCKHKETGSGYYSYYGDPSRATIQNICKECGTIVSDFSAEKIISDIVDTYDPYKNLKGLRK